MRRPLLAIALLTGTASGCAQFASGTADQEAGLQRNAFFGDAIMNNTLVATGERDPLAILAQRFGGEVPDTVTFAFDSAEITPEARAVLDAQAGWMRRFPELGFRVYGHADAPGGGAYNERLGRARAQAVVRYLAGRGVDSGRLEALVSYGETRPAVPGAGREQANRRVVTEVSHFMDDPSHRMDGKYGLTVYESYIDSAEPDGSIEVSAEGGGEGG